MIASKMWGFSDGVLTWVMNLAPELIAPWDISTTIPQWLDVAEEDDDAEDESLGMADDEINGFMSDVE